MKSLMKCLTAVAVVAGFGFATQSTSAAGPVKVKPTIVHYPTYPQTFPQKITPIVKPFPVIYPTPIVKPYPVYPIYPVYPVYNPILRVDYDYVVLYKPSFFSGAQVFGRYETLFQAQNAASNLEFKGFPTRIERFRDTGWYGW